MREPSKPGFVRPVAATIAVLLGLCVGAYDAMVWPGYPGNEDFSVVIPRYSIDIELESDRSVANLFFAPIHWLDRRIRPHVWEPTWEPPPK